MPMGSVPAGSDRATPGQGGDGDGASGVMCVRKGTKPSAAERKENLCQQQLCRPQVRAEGGAGTGKIPKMCVSLPWGSPQ